MTQPLLIVNLLWEEVHEKVANVSCCSNSKNVPKYNPKKYMLATNQDKLRQDPD